MTKVILTLNAGSSSVKFSLFARKKTLSLVAHGEVTDLGNAPAFKAVENITGADTAKKLPAKSSHEDAIKIILDWVHGHEKGWHVAAVAHRIVHGGTEFTESVRITPAIRQKLEKLCPLAPLHQPHNLAALDIAAKLLPKRPQIGCFDTAFHAHRDPLFSLYALPRELTEKGIRRYGFHGLSYEWIAHALRQDHPVLARGRVIAAHLGNGSSLCAMQGGRSIDTTMGMTALDGLPMGTRSGALDPGAVLYMIRDLGFSPNAAEHILYEKSGLKGLSGLTNDMKALLKATDKKAKFAVQYYALKVAQFMGMIAVALGGVDGIVFTGGIGENAARVREAVLNRIAFLGDPQVLVIPANEERIMAMQTARLL